MNFWQDLERHAGRVAFVTAAGDTLDYAALAHAADAVFDLPRGTPVLLALDNDLAAMSAYLGALRRVFPRSSPPRGRPPPTVSAPTG